MHVRFIYKILPLHFPMFYLGHACHQHRWESSVCSSPRMEPKRHLQPLHLRHQGCLLHFGLGECPEQQRPWGQCHDRPLWGMSQGTCSPEPLQCLGWLMKAQHGLFPPSFLIWANYVASFHLGEGVSYRTFVMQSTEQFWEGPFVHQVHRPGSPRRLGDHQGKQWSN